MPPRGLSRARAYDFLRRRHEHGELIDEAERRAQPFRQGLPDDLDERTAALNRLAAENFELMAALQRGEVEIPSRPQAVDEARELRFQVELARYIVETTPTPRRLTVPKVAVSAVQPHLESYFKREMAEGRLAHHLTRDLSDLTGIPPYTITRIRRGERKTLTREEAHPLLEAIGRPDLAREVEDNLALLEDEMDREAERLEPILLYLARMAIHRYGDFSDEERAALEDFHAHGRGKIPLSVRKEAERILRAQKRRAEADARNWHRETGGRAEDYDDPAKWTAHITPQRIGELTRGARRAGFLPAKSRPRGFRPTPQPPATWTLAHDFSPTTSPYPWLLYTLTGPNPIVLYVDPTTHIVHADDLAPTEPFEPLAPFDEPPRAPAGTQSFTLLAPLAPLASQKSHKSTTPQGRSRPLDRLPPRVTHAHARPDAFLTGGGRAHQPARQADPRPPQAP